MPRLSVFLAAVLLLGGAVLAQNVPTLPADTRLIVRVTTAMSSRTASVGDVVETSLVEHRPPLAGPGAGRAFLEPGTRVTGVVEHVRKAERETVGAELRIVFRDVAGGTPRALRMDARVLVAGRRHEVTRDGTLTVRAVERGTWGEEAMLGVPLAAGMGLMVGRRGWTAAVGAAVGFLSLYLPPRWGTTSDRFADVELKPGDRLGLFVQF